MKPFDYFRDFREISIFEIVVRDRGERWKFQGILVHRFIERVAPVDFEDKQQTLDDFSAKLT
jgi:hypothetical protein